MHMKRFAEYYFEKEGEKKKKKSYSRLSVLLGINIIGFLRERSNFTAGDPSISLRVNDFSVFVFRSFTLTISTELLGTRPMK